MWLGRTRAAEFGYAYKFVYEPLTLTQPHPKWNNDMPAVCAFSVRLMLVPSGASAFKGIYHGKGSDLGSYRRAQSERSQLHEAR